MLSFSISTPVMYHAFKLICPGRMPVPSDSTIYATNEGQGAAQQARSSRKLNAYCQIIASGASHALYANLINVARLKT